MRPKGKQPASVCCSYLSVFYCKTNFVEQINLEGNYYLNYLISKLARRERCFPSDVRRHFHQEVYGRNVLQDNSGK